MYLSLAAWLAIWSMANVERSPNMISATGLMPVIAAPTATPIMADSEMGVSRTLSSPNSSARPFVTLKAPCQYLPTSSPIMNTELSLAISSCNASRSASRYETFLILSHLRRIRPPTLLPDRDMDFPQRIRQLFLPQQRSHPRFPSPSALLTRCLSEASS